ncbi:TPA: MFS transporter [Streptococcus suis]
MGSVSIWRTVILLFSLVAVQLIHYEDDRYQPFGFRYWLCLVACLWLNLVTLASYVVTYAAGSIMVYNQFEKALAGIFFLCLLGAAMLTFLSFKAISIMIRRTNYYKNIS